MYIYTYIHNYIYIYIGQPTNYSYFLVPFFAQGVSAYLHDD